MFGKPKDVEGECNAHLYLGDDYGGGTATIRCSLQKGHIGLHYEGFTRGKGRVSTTWDEDEKHFCGVNGCKALIDDCEDHTVEEQLDAEEERSEKR